MEKNLTNEEIEKVFHLYHKAEVKWRKHTYPCFHVFNGLLENLIQECRLILAPLPIITDEHAIEVAKIAAGRPKHYTIDDADITRNGSTVEVVFLDKPDECINIGFNGDVLVYIHEKGGNRLIEKRPSSQSEYIDKIRELGYALPYKGIDLFEAGLAIDATTVKQKL